MHIVIADDEMLLRDGLGRLLTEAGFTVAGMAANPEELRSLVATTRTDVAIIDIKMLAILRTTFTTRVLVQLTVVVGLLSALVGLVVNVVA